MSRRAYTLVELLIVLSLIVIIMGLMASPMSRMNARYRLSAAAKELQTELHQTRILAMKSGESRVFLYFPGSSRYEIVTKRDYDLMFPRRKQQKPTDSSLLGRSSPVGDVEVIGSSVPSLGDFAAETVSLGDMVEPTSLGDLIGEDGPPSFGTDLSGIAAGMSPDVEPVIRKTLADDVIFLADSRAGGPVPIFFFPNGRTSNAELAVMMPEERPYLVSLSLRGLSGSVRMGKVEPYTLPL